MKWVNSRNRHPISADEFELLKFTIVQDTHIALYKYSPARYIVVHKHINRLLDHFILEDLQCLSKAMLRFNSMIKILQTNKVKIIKL